MQNSFSLNIQQEQLFANAKKCVFSQSRVEYLGHVITAEGVFVDHSKVRSMLNWPLPTSLKAPHSLTFDSTAEKICFFLNEEATQAFQQLKATMVSLRVLALPDFSKDFVIETNASEVGVGAVLMQEERPLAYFSHKLSPHDQAKSVYERELMAMVLAVKKWRPYLLGRKFIIRPTKGASDIFWNNGWRKVNTING